MRRPQAEASTRSLFIINPRSGTPKFVTRLHYLIRKQFGPENRQLSVVKSRSIEHIRDLVRRAVEDGTELVVAVGGDGTINTVATDLVGTPTVLGVLPTGSGNGFARNLGIPLKIEKALELLLEPPIARIDVGRLEDRIFLVSCGIGWEAEIASNFDVSRIRGILPYAAAVVTTFMQYEPQEIELTAEPGGWSYRGSPMLFTVANMREFGMGVAIAPDAKYADGMLDVCMLPKHDLLSALRYGPEMWRQNTQAIPGFLHRLASSIKITRPEPGIIHLDGSPLKCGREIEITVQQSALRIVADHRNLQ